MNLIKADRNHDTDRTATPSTQIAADTRGVLFVLPWNPDHIGGVNEVVVSLFRWFSAKAGISPRLIVNSYGSFRLEKESTERLGWVHRLYIPSPSGTGRLVGELSTLMFRMPVSLVRLFTYCRRENISVINFHYPSLAALPTLLLTRLSNRSVQLVLSFHGTDFDDVERCTGSRKLLWRFVMGKCDAVVVCSQAMRDRIRRAFPGLNLPLQVIHNGIDSHKCRSAVPSASLPGDLLGTRYIVNAATFETKKGQDVLIEGFQRVAARYPDLYLVLIGRSGPTLQESRALAARSDYADRILIYPDLAHKDALVVMANAELFVLPSRSEPFGLVLLEAACLDVPLVASRVEGIPEIVTDRSTGLLVTPDDPDALGQAIQSLLDDKSTATRYARDLRRSVEQNFTLERTAGKYAALFAGDGILK